MSPVISLQGQVGIVTGGSRGIGAATALLLAEAGADIVLNYFRDDTAASVLVRQISSCGRRVEVVRGDISAARTASILVDRALSAFSRIDIVVNNAGIWTHGEIGAMDEGVWCKTIETNLNSVFHLCNAAVPYLKRRKGGRIINIASTAGQRGEAQHSHYAASKGGIIAFTKSLATELAPHGILVNAVAPGWVDTDMNEEVFADTLFRTRVCDAIPLRRIAVAEDVAGSVLFLASDLSRHITGATINVNGGSVLS